MLILRTPGLGQGVDSTETLTPSAFRLTVAGALLKCILLGIMPFSSIMTAFIIPAIPALPSRCPTYRKICCQNLATNLERCAYICFERSNYYFVSIFSTTKSSTCRVSFVRQIFILGILVSPKTRMNKYSLMAPNSSGSPCN